MKDSRELSFEEEVDKKIRFVAIHGYQSEAADEIINMVRENDASGNEQIAEDAFEKGKEIGREIERAKTVEKCLAAVYDLMIPTGNHEYHDEILHKAIAAIKGAGDNG